MILNTVPVNCYTYTYKSLYFIIITLSQKISNVGNIIATILTKGVFFVF